MHLAINNINHSPFDNWIDRALFSLYKGVLKWNDNVFSFFKAILGIIGLVLAIPILFLLSIVGWVFMLSLNYRLERDMEDYNSLVNTWDDRKKMEEHLELERSVRILGSLMKKANSQKFIINPVTKQAVIFYENLITMEQALKKSAYPKINEPLSDKESAYLLSVFQGAECEDWKDESALSYEL